MTPVTRRRLVRWWMIGLACYAAGITCHVIFELRYGFPMDRLEDAMRAGIQFGWFALGLCLVGIDLHRMPAAWRRKGWTLWLIAALAAWYMTVSSAG